MAVAGGVGTVLGLLLHVDLEVPSKRFGGANAGSFLYPAPIIGLKLAEVKQKNVQKGLGLLCNKRVCQIKNPILAPNPSGVGSLAMEGGCINYSKQMP